MKLLKTIFLVMLYLFLIIFLLVIGALIYIAPILLFEWTYMQSALFLGGVVLGILALCWFLSWLRRRKERKFVQQVITEDEAAIQQQPDREREAMRSMQGSWAQAIRTLQRSKLRRKGNPLYVLPWYMVIGDPGTGKSSAARGSRLMSTLGGVGESARLGSASPCEWWFMDNSIVLDVNGRYTLGNETEAREWFGFLDQLSKYRVREPIDGVIVTLPVDMLLEQGSEAVADYGRRIRQRLDALIRKLGHRFPVYVMVTKADHLLGMNDFLSLLPDNTLEQGMGILNDRLDDAPEVFADKALENIGLQMRDLRLLLLHRYQRKYPDLMCLPDEVLRLQGGVHTFVRSAFQENPYQIAPQMRGLFLSSAKREGAPAAQRLHDLGLPEEAPDKPEHAGEPAFLHDFFGSILPRDRGLYTPVPELLRWQQLKRNLGFIAMLCIGVALCAMMSAAFMQQAHLLKEYKKSLQLPAAANAQKIEDADLDAGKGSKPAAQTTSIRQSLNELKTLRDSINVLEEQNSNIWWTRLFLFGESNTLETRLKRYYASQFRERIVLEVDEALRVMYLNQAKPSDPQVAVAGFFEWSVRLTNLARLESKGEVTTDTFQQYPVPSTLTLALAAKDTDQTELMTLYPGMFRDYYLWMSNPKIFREEQVLLQARMVDMVKNDRAALFNIVTWANNQDTLQDITFADFWGQQTDVSGGAVIKRAYTSKGQQTIKSMLAQTRAALLEFNTEAKTDAQKEGRADLQAFIEERMKQFGAGYISDAFNAWRYFMGELPKGMYRIKSEEGLRQVAQSTCTLSGPYWGFIERAATELPAICNKNTKLIESQYPWAALLINFQKWQANSKYQSIYNSSTSLKWLGKLANAVDKKASKATKNTAPALKLDAQGQVDPSSYYLQFEEAMSKLSPPTGPDAPNIAYQNLSAFFEAQGGASSSKSDTAAAPAAAGAAAGKKDPPAFQQAMTAFNDLKKSVDKGSASIPEADQQAWALFRGPIDLNLYYSTWQVAKVLESEWESQVLNQVRTAPSQQVPELLFGQEKGYVWTFTGGKAKPFLSQNSKGEYYPTRVFDQEIPFLKPFLDFLTVGKQGSWSIQQSYTLDINGEPTDVNQRAREMPYAIVLTQQKAKGATRLKNLNYPVSQTFEWKPEESSSVELQIQFIGVTLIKNYGGQYGMIYFADEFKDGAHTFTPDDFPQSKDLLEGLGVKRITVRFTFNQTQLDALLRLKKILELTRPQRIVREFGKEEETPPAKQTPPNKNGGSADKAKPATTPKAPAQPKTPQPRKIDTYMPHDPSTAQPSNQATPPAGQTAPPQGTPSTAPANSQPAAPNGSSSPKTQKNDWRLVPNFEDAHLYF